MAPNPSPGDGSMPEIDQTIDATLCHTPAEASGAAKVVRISELALEIDQARSGFETRDGATWFHFGGWASTDAEDAYGDIILPSAWAKSVQRTDVPYLHTHDQKLVLGRVAEMHIVDSGPGKHGLYADRCEVLVTPWTESQVIPFIQAGVLKGQSVGFRIKKYAPLDPQSPWGGWEIQEADLKELSVCAIPANSDCWIDKSLRAEHARYCRQLADGFAPPAPVAFPTVPWAPTVGTASIAATDLTAILTDPASTVLTAPVDQTRGAHSVSVTVNVGDGDGDMGSDDEMPNEMPGGKKPSPPKDDKADVSDEAKIGRLVDGVIEEIAATRNVAAVGEDGLLHLGGEVVSHLVGPREGEDPDAEASWRLPVAELVDGTLTVDPARLQLTMGLLFTRKLAGVLTEPERAAALVTLRDLYVAHGLALPTVKAAEVTPEAAYADICFRNDERTLVTHHVLRGHVGATLAGVNHLVKHALTVQPADVAACQELAVRLIEALPEPEALSLLALLRGEASPDATEPARTANDAPETDEALSPEDEALVRSLEIDPTEPGWREQLAAALDALEEDSDGTP